MSITEITNKVNQLANHWEQFKSLNERRLAEIEKKGSADSLTVSSLEKLGNAIDQINLASQRPNIETVSSNSTLDVEHKNAFVSYLKKGLESGLSSMERKSLSSSSDADGGYLITKGMANSVVTSISNASPIRSIASVTNISGDALEVIQDYDNAAAGWTLESDARGETKSPQLAKVVIPAHELYAQPKATQKLVDDASIDMEKWLADKLIESFCASENAAFIYGDGVGKPQGILAYEAGLGANKIQQIASGKKGVITAQGLFNLYYSLSENFAVKAKFVMNRAALQAIRMLKDESTGQYLWQPSLSQGSANTILGMEVVESADMPILADGAIAVAFGDFESGYQIVDRQGIRILRDPFTEKPFIKFYATKRVGGGLINGNAIKLLQLSA